MIKPRNPFANAPIMRKGGVHERSRSAKRARQKRQLEIELTEWDQGNDGFPEKKVAGSMITSTPPSKGSVGTAPIENPRRFEPL